VLLDGQLLLQVHVAVFSEDFLGHEVFASLFQKDAYLSLLPL
jgi:hypothetical protein